MKNILNEVRFTSKFTLSVVLILFIIGCQDDDKPIATQEQNAALYSATDLSKTILEHNCTVFSTGMNNVFADTSFSFNSTDFCRNFTGPAFFLDDNSGYFSVEGMDGIVISDPINTSREGISNLNEKDADGKEITSKLLSIVNHADGGFYEFNSLNPNSNATEKYTAYVKSLPQINAYIRSGFFHANSSNLYSQNEVNEHLVKNSVVAMAKAFGGLYSGLSLDSLDGIDILRSYLQNIRFFDNQSGYFYVLDFNGYNIVQPPDPSVQGTNRYDLQDSRGTYLVRGLIDMAKSGGGFYTYYYLNYQTNKEEMKKAYVAPIPGTNYFLGAGVYLN